MFTIKTAPTEPNTISKMASIEYIHLSPVLSHFTCPLKHVQNSHL